ncbi:hypothetical protein SDC9_171096 [bioreactor metagenome]|uniref:Uncharacterized protein n=1 Tax=bioreactor metagenome TaxID=1076179 RepID=A0A645GJ06_9ZZZZ
MLKAHQFLVFPILLCRKHLILVEYRHNHLGALQQILQLVLSAIGLFPLRPEQMRFVYDHDIHFILRPVIIDERGRFRNEVGLLFAVDAQFGRDLLIDLQLLLVIHQEEILRILENQVFRVVLG